MLNLSPDTVEQIIATVAIGIIAVVGSIRGAIRGAEVGAEATRAATQQAIDAQLTASQAIEVQQRNAVRLLLRLEIDHNLANLSTLWADVTRDEVYDDSDDPEQQRKAMGQNRASALLRVPMPVWTRSAWDGLIPLLPLALARSEIAEASTVYGQLDTISAIRSQLAEMAAEQPWQEVVQSDVYGPRTRTIHPQTFSDNAPDLWGRIEEVVDQLLTHGNPIAEA
jgi:hypothetical protein